MLMPKKNRIAIYELLFKEGVMHRELADKNVPNLHVMKAMQSLKSTGYVKEQFAWRHFYWYLTNEGIQYLRDFLHLTPEIVPATLRRQMRPETARPRPKGRLHIMTVAFSHLGKNTFLHDPETDKWSRKVAIFKTTGKNTKSNHVGDLQVGKTEFKKEARVG
uniref:Ribosomal protein S10 n=1 Tax=Oncorhynchus kisutch TaxID=8019 RepID=A0A8C7JPL8_ONCKI